MVTVSEKQPARQGADLRFSGARVLRAAGAATLLGAAGTLLGFIVARRDTYFAYLAAFSFVTSIALGGLIFLLISHVVGARWSIVLRRLNEVIISVLPMLALLFVPLAFGLRDLYIWTDPAPPWPEHALEVLHHRQLYLNAPFFLARTAVYFAIWLVAARLLERWSSQVDASAAQGHQSLASVLLSAVPFPAGPQQPPAAGPPPARARAFSAGLLPPVALAVTFAAFDWLMSLDPLWASSLFGVYYFAGGFVASFGLLTLLAHYTRRGAAAAAIRPPHFHALGRLMLGFTVFWAYCAFFQVMLIQMANRPDEVTFYVARSSGGFRWLSFALGAGRFVLPFFVLLPRAPKFRSGLMAAVGAWIVLGQYADMLWLVAPAQRGAGPYAALWYFCTLLALSGACVLFAALRLRGKAVLPIGDPALAQSIAYRSPT